MKNSTDQINSINDNANTKSAQDQAKNEPLFISYLDAVRWSGGSYILCNSVTEDESILENARFSWYDEEDTCKEIYQYFITDFSESLVEWYEENFSLLFTYSNALDLFILCVDHCGTHWSGVPCEVKKQDIKEIVLRGGWEFDKVCHLWRSKK